MSALQTLKNQPFHIDMLRDQYVVIERRAGDSTAAKKAFAKLNRTLKTMPRSKVDTVADLRKTRESRGRV